MVDAFGVPAKCAQSLTQRRVQVGRLVLRQVERPILGMRCRSEQGQGQQPQKHILVHNESVKVCSAQPPPVETARTAWKKA